LAGKGFEYWSQLRDKPKVKNLRSQLKERHQGGNSADEVALLRRKKQRSTENDPATYQKQEKGRNFHRERKQKKRGILGWAINGVHVQPTLKISTGKKEKETQQWIRHTLIGKLTNEP